MAIVTCPKCGEKLRGVFVTGGKNPMRVPFHFCEKCRKFYELAVKEA